FQENMSERTNFKLAYGGATHKFTSTYKGEELLMAVKAKVSSVVNDRAAELCWIDDESSCVLDTVDDLQTAIEFAKFTRKSDTACPCISLVIAGTEEAKAAVAEDAAAPAPAVAVVETPVTEEQVTYAIEKAEGVNENETADEKRTEQSEGSDESSSDEEDSEDSDEESDDAEKPQLGVGMQALMRHLQEARHQMNLEKLGAINDMEKAKEEEKDETDQMCKRINATVKRIKTSLLKDFEDGKSRFEGNMTDCVKAGDDNELDLDVTQESDEEEEEVVETEEKKDSSTSFWSTLAKGMAAIVPPPPIAPPAAVEDLKETDVAPRLITEDMVASLRKGLEETVLKMENESAERKQVQKEKMVDVSNKAEDAKESIEKRQHEKLKECAEKLAAEAREASLDLSIALAAAEQNCTPSAEKMAEYARLCASGLTLKAKFLKQVEAEKREKELKTRETALALKEDAFVKKVAEFAVKMEDVEEKIKRMEERVEKIGKDEKMEGLEKRLDAMEERLAKVEEQMDEEDIVYM
ncbi:hypothetical protein PRIPAC_75836, partial [Pristionchus pacificus]|uniref:Uncharacterized protein n=1 Tax=Pristionchus pacificus TaxID=54126 RepID=A0A2A6C0N9_PRIPA